MNEYAIGITACIFLIPVLFTGIELSFGLALVGVIGLIILSGFHAAFSIFAQDFYDSLSSYTLTVIPLFILMGQIAFRAGIAEKLYATANKFIGRIPGGLAMATVVAATMFKAMCGSTTATTATFAGVAIPLMTRYNYSKRLSTGVVASVGSIGMLFPPSMVMIIYGIMTETSIGRLFIAGIIPGLLLSIFFLGIIFVWCKINPALGAASTEVFTLKEKMQSLPEFLYVAIIFIVVIGGLTIGLFTPTESGTIGAIAMLVLAILRKSITFKTFITCVDDAMCSAVMIGMLIACSLILGHLLTITQLPQVAAQWLTGLPLPRAAIMVIILFFYLLGGSIIDDMAFVVLITPVLFPAVLKLGYDPIWFGMILGVTIMVGTIIPPVAIGVFVVKNVTGEPFSTIYSGVVPFLVSFIFVAVLLFLFPDMANWLPNLLMGKQ